MNAQKLLSELRALDIRLFVKNGRLRCSAPKGRLTRDLESRIAEQKAELIELLLGSIPQNDAVSRRTSSEASLPLSFSQERFWFLQNFDPESRAFNITAFRRIPAPIDARRLEAALRALCARHEALRTSFPEVDGTATQMVRAQAAPELAIYSLEWSAESEQADPVDTLIQKLSQHKFDLACDLLVRASLIRLDNDKHVIVLTMHHIISDGWSIGILFEELEALYNSYGVPDALPALPIQYADYALWERRRFSSAAVASQLEYWKKKLTGAAPFLELPLDYPRPTSAGAEAALYRFQLDADASESLKRLARQHGATLFMTLLAIFQALLFRYTRQRDILVGTPVSSRKRPELEQLIGCFINTQVLRTEVSPEITTRQLLAAVRSTVIESLDNPDAPFEELVKELVTERDLSRSPLFQVAFILQNTPKASEYDVVSGGTAFDLTLYTWESNGHIGGSLEYRVDLFQHETISRLAGCFTTLCAQMAADPDAAVGLLPVLNGVQATEWFESGNGPQLSYPRDLCTHEWVEQQAAKTPEAVAVIFEEQRLTYRELSARSNRLAHRLRALGVGPDRLVGLCLERSIDLVVAPLAVWKAGGAYVPLDPKYPSQRLAFMLEDSGAAVLITESHLLANLPQTVAQVVCLDRDRALLEGESSALPAPLATAQNLSYVIYTSGSTGKPKGVEVEHRSLVNFLTSMQHEPGMKASDRLLAVTTLSFDIAGLELYLPLVSGAQVVIAPRAAAFDGAALAKLLREAEISVMQATPVTWRLLLESGWQGSAGLKILCGGEALTRELAERLLGCGAELWNLYGPTETTIWSTVQRVEAGAGRVGIGHPIANTQTYVMDESGQLTPPGVVGELYLGGDGLARGYLHGAELTAERFVADPWHAGERLYRTGDLARWLGDGTLECIARVDHQVKLRGFRVELGEIEAALEQQAGITQAVVVVREDKPGDERLVAYVTVAERTAAEPGALRQALQALLPEYMVPSAFVRLEQFPLTPNRKVDRKALPAPEYRSRRAGETASARSGAVTLRGDRSQPVNGLNRPESHVELVMTEIWREVLGVEHVGMFDNFFELGGHSLSATRLIARTRSVLGMDLPLRCIFIDPTIASLSRHIFYDSDAQAYRYAREMPRWNCLVPAQPKGKLTPFFFVAGYQNPDDTLLVLSRLIPHLGLDQPVFGFRPRWIEDANHEYASVEDLAREFLAELRAVQPKGPYLLGGHCVGGIAALEISKLLKKEDEEVKLLVFVDTDRPTAMGVFQTEFYNIRDRVVHIAEVLAGIVHPGNQTRGEIIRELIRRKSGIAMSQEALGAIRLYQAKVRYRRLLSTHAPEKYSGRIALIVNQEQARVRNDLGWRGVAPRLEVYALPGNHDTMLRNHGKEVAHVIRECIGRPAEQLNWRVKGIEVNAS